LAAAPLFVEKLNREIDAVLTDPKLKARLADLGGVPVPMTPPEFGKFIADETEKWAKVIKFAGIKPEGAPPGSITSRSAKSRAFGLATRHLLQCMSSRHRGRRLTALCLPCCRPKG